MHRYSLVTVSNNIRPKQLRRMLPAFILFSKRYAEDMKNKTVKKVSIVLCIVARPHIKKSKGSGMSINYFDRLFNSPANS